VTSSFPTIASVTRPRRSLNQVLDVFEVLHVHGSGLGVTELANLLGTSKGALHAVLSNLEARGYVRKTTDRRYRLGLRLWELGSGVEKDLGLRDAARPHLEELTRLTGESTHLSIYDSGEVLYLDKVTTPHAVQAYTTIGGRAPAHCVATGKCLLAFQDDAEIQRVLADLPKFTDATITNAGQMAAHLEHIRQEGYATNTGEWRADVVGVAAPIKGLSGTVVASVGVSGPLFRLAESDPHAMAELVVKAANTISRDLGTCDRRLASSPSGLQADGQMGL
jgi:IclR family transcriptional regulator, KDG regulon repressor